MRFARFVLVGFALFVPAAPARVGAAEPVAGIDLEIFRPAIDSKGYITLDSSQVLGHLDTSFGLVTTWGRGVLRLENAQGALVIENILTPQLQAAVGLFRVLELGIGLPLTVTGGQGIPAHLDRNPNLNYDYAFGEQGVGDLQIHSKVRLLHPARNPVGLGLGLSISLPTGNANAFLGEDQVLVEPRLLVDKELGASRRLRAAVNVGARIRPETRTFTDTGAMPAPPDPAIPMRPGTGLVVETGTEALWGAALSYAVVPERLDLLGEVYGAFGPTGQRNRPAEALAGLKVYLAHNSYFELGGGVGLTGTASYGAASGGRVFVGFLYEPRVGDRDGDGIPDDIDRCPDEPGVAAEGGCPEPPLVLPPEPLPAPPPPRPEPEPEPELVVEHRGVLETLKPIFFETDKDVILPVSYPVLDALGRLMVGAPHILEVEIQGHADERGSDAHNMDLTERRAQAVLRYLVGRGVEASRLRARGYGETRPTCREHETGCWSENRRVEFVIVKRVGDPAPPPGVPAGRKY